MRTRTRSALVLLATALVVGVTVAVTLSGSSHHVATTSAAGPPSTFDGAQLPGDVRAPGFTLTDQRGRRATLSEYRGRVVVLAFLDSNCAPACVLVAQ
jgi:cytochrome oxidase Cu insertion factor (SCO1/SenC/PrrC family)